MATQTLAALDTAHIDAISDAGSEPEWLRRYRQESFSIYDTLPLETSPLYNKYTDVSKMDPSGIIVSSDHAALPIPRFLDRRLRELKDEAYVLQVGSSTKTLHIPDDMTQDGVVVSSISDAISERPEQVQDALRSSDSGEDRFTALNNAAFNAGIFVQIPPDVTLKRLIHMLYVLPEGISSISRDIIHAGAHSSATLVQEIYSYDAGSQAHIDLLNTFLEPGSRLDVTTLQMMNQNSYNFSTRRTHLAADANINWYLGLFGSILSRYRIGYHLNGMGASANDSEVVFGNGSQSFDIRADMVHNSPSTEGRITEKSILQDKSRSLFKGMIRINEGATKSNSYLSGRSILLGRQAKSDAIPGLEILTNDVKATHSASVAQVDDEQIFYLMTRCLSRKGAERTIVEGFLEPLSRRMSIQIRAWIAYLIESKWEGRPLSINTDAELRRFVEVEETRYNENAEIEQHYKYR